MAPRGLAGFIVGGVPKFLAQKTITVDAGTDNSSGIGIPRIVTVDDPMPQQAFKYVAAIATAVGIAAEVFNPSPASAARASVISAAWAPANPAPQQPDNTRVAAFATSPVAAQADAADFVPFTRHLEVLGAWEPIRFSVTQQVKIGALYPNQDAVPFTRHLEMLGAWTVTDPLPQTNRKLAQDQLIEGVPFTRHLEVLGAWAPVPYSVTLPVKIAPIVSAAVVVADVPPPLTRRLETILGAWVAAPTSPVLSAKLVQPQAVVAVTDQVPFRRGLDWTPWDEAVPVKLVVSHAATDNAVAPTVQNDNPPFGQRRFTTWAWGPPVAYPGGGGEFVPQDVQLDSVPAGREWLDIVVRAWAPPAPLPTLPKKFTQAQAQVAPTVDNPPFGRRLLRPDVFDALPYPNPTLGGVKLVQPGIAAQPDNPPFTSRRTQDWTHFYPPPPLPTLTAKLLQPGANNDIPLKGRALWDWANFKPIDPNPTLGRGPLARPDPPDNPPFNQRRTQDYIHFKPIDPLPTLTVKLPQQQIPATADNPPFTQRHTQFWTHWYPPNPQPDPLPTLGRIKQTPPSTNTPVPPVIITQPPPDYGGDWWLRHHHPSKGGKRCRFVTIDGVLTWICDNPSWERAAQAREQALDLVYDAEGDLEPLYEALRVEEATNTSEAKRNAATLLMQAIHEAVLEEEDDDFLLMM